MTRARNVSVQICGRPVLSDSDISSFGWYAARQADAVEAYCKAHPETVSAWQAKIDAWDRAHESEAMLFERKNAQGKKRSTNHATIVTRRTEPVKYRQQERG